MAANQHVNQHGDRDRHPHVNALPHRHRDNDGDRHRDLHRDAHGGWNGDTDGNWQRLGNVDRFIDRDQDRDLNRNFDQKHDVVANVAFRCNRYRDSNRKWNCWSRLHRYIHGNLYQFRNYHNSSNCHGYRNLNGHRRVDWNIDRDGAANHDHNEQRHRDVITYFDWANIHIHNVGDKHRNFRGGDANLLHDRDRYSHSVRNRHHD